jgi:CRP/FNR family cyclic AMP-dependent transcriptional regulator
VSLAAGPQRDSEGAAVNVVHCTVPQAANRGFLASLPPDLRAEITGTGRVVAYEPGELLPSRGASPSPGVVLSGLVRLYVTGSNGRQATVHYLREGDAIGLARMFRTDLPGEFRAVHPARVMLFQRQRVERLMKTDAGFTRAIAAELARFVSASELALESFLSRSVRQRLAAHLLAIAAVDQEGRLVAKITQRGLADAVGSVRDVVARAIRDLRDDGIVMVLHGGVLLVDSERLRREAAGERPKSQPASRS